MSPDVIKFGQRLSAPLGPVRGGGGVNLHILPFLRGGFSLAKRVVPVSGSCLAWRLQDRKRYLKRQGSKKVASKTGYNPIKRLIVNMVSGRQPGLLTPVFAKYPAPLSMQLGPSELKSCETKQEGGELGIFKPAHSS